VATMWLQLCAAVLGAVAGANAFAPQPVGLARHVCAPSHTRALAPRQGVKMLAGEAPSLPPAAEIRRGGVAEVSGRLATPDRELAERVQGTALRIASGLSSRVY
jgi:hypothetical protein